MAEKNAEQHRRSATEKEVRTFWGLGALGFCSPFHSLNHVSTPTQTSLLWIGLPFWLISSYQLYLVIRFQACLLPCFMILCGSRIC